MHRGLVRAVLAMALLGCACSLGITQTAGLPDTAPGTGELPGAPPATGTMTTEDPTVTPPPTATPELPAAAKRSSLMVKRGDMELEWRTAYSHFSKSSIFIDGVAMLPVMVVGEVAVENTRRDILITSLAGRYGIIDNLQGEIKVPFRYQFERRAIPQANPPQEETLSGFGLGDIEAGCYYQLKKGSETGFRWIGNVQLKTATGKDIFAISDDEVPLGTGFWSTKVGITGVKVVDPGAIYFSVGYTYNWERKNIRVVTEDVDTGDQTVTFVNVKPGNTLDLGAGIAYALNPRLSINTGFAVSFNGSSTSNGNALSNTAITSASLRLGAIWVTEKQRPIDLSISMGLTDDSPDFTLELRQNFKFK